KQTLPQVGFATGQKIDSILVVRLSHEVFVGSRPASDFVCKFSDIPESTSPELVDFLATVGALHRNDYASFRYRVGQSADARQGLGAEHMKILHLLPHAPWNRGCLLKTCIQYG